MTIIRTRNQQRIRAVQEHLAIILIRYQLGRPIVCAGFALNRILARRQARAVLRHYSA